MVAIYVNVGASLAREGVTTLGLPGESRKSHEDSRKAHTE